MKALNERNYVVIDGVEVEVDSEVGKAYRNMQDAKRITQHRRGECCCPKGLWYLCSTDCATCKYRKCNNISLDTHTTDDNEGNFEGFIFRQAMANYKSFEDIIVQRDLARTIIAWLKENAPELIEFGILKMKGYANAEAAKKLNIKRSTLDSRRAKFLAFIKREFPDFSF